MASTPHDVVSPTSVCVDACRCRLFRGKKKRRPRLRGAEHICARKLVMVDFYEAIDRPGISNGRQLATSTPWNRIDDATAPNSLKLWRLTLANKSGFFGWKTHAICLPCIRWRTCWRAMHLCLKKIEIAPGCSATIFAPASRPVFILQPHVYWISNW